MQSFRKLLLANKAWVAGRLEVTKDFFEAMARAQQPEYLWIGCSDSRIPSEEITGTEPGELFVHRNVANLVVQNDINAHSVIQYAVEVLKVKHVIVCGHYGCGGVRASMTTDSFGLIDQWLNHIKNVQKNHQQELSAIADSEKRTDRLVELNVMTQVQNLAQTDAIKKAWAERKAPIIHGWVYDLRTGYLKDMFKISPQ